MSNPARPFFAMHVLLPTNLVSGALEAGCDEAGRGCLAGPVVAAAVILPDGFSHELLVDSKKLTEAQRLEAGEIVMENAVAWGLGVVSAADIDAINILNASILAMHKALEALSVIPRHVAVDGNRFKPWNFVPFTTVVKGDARLANIAAASILAKTHRDAIMAKMHAALPVYGFDSHKGYPTQRHYQAIAEHGPSAWHRYTFKGVVK